jgi:hypothetical protein
MNNLIQKQEEQEKQGTEETIEGIPRLCREFLV